MNYIILLQAALAFSMGIASLFVVYKLLNIYLKKSFVITELNHSYAILQIGILLSSALLIMFMRIIVLVLFTSNPTHSRLSLLSLIVSVRPLLL